MSVLDGVALRQLLQAYPAVAALPEPLRNAVLTSEAQSIQAPAGAVLFEEGAPCRGFPMVLSGSIRVARGSPGGRSLELYRVTPGEMCVVSTACLFRGNAPLTAYAACSEATEAVLLSHTGFARWCEEPGFRNYVFGLFASRLAELMALTEAVAFQRLDQRLAERLLAEGKPELQCTHQQLADELGTVREMVSRLLKRFEREGFVSVGRERVLLLAPEALRALANDRFRPSLPSP